MVRPGWSSRAGSVGGVGGTPNASKLNRRGGLRILGRQAAYVKGHRAILDHRMSQPSIA